MTDRLKLVDFVAKNDSVTLDDFPERSQRRINDVLADLTGTDSDPSPGGAGNIIVSQERDTTEDGIFGTIQAAIDDEGTNAGATVFVEPGEYGGTVTIDTERLTVVSTNGPDQTTIQGRVVAESDGVTLDGFTVSPPTATGTAESEAIRVSGTPNDVTITNNVVEEFDRGPDGGFYGVDGINVFGGDGNTAIENATVTDNVVRNLRNEVSGGVAGISIQGNVDGATVENNVLTELGEGVTAYGFGVVIRETGNHDESPRNVSVVDNELSAVRSDDGGLFGVGLGVEADGSNYAFENNDIDDIDLGTEFKRAAEETSLRWNTLSGTDIHLADVTGDVDLAAVVTNNTLDGAAAASDLRRDSYQQAIYPNIRPAIGAVVPGARIDVFAGTYDEGLPVGSPDAGTDPESAPKAGLQLVGHDRPTVDGFVQILDPGITFEGFEVTGEVNGFGVAIFEPGVTVRDVTVSGVTSGIFVPSREGVNVEDCLVEDYSFYGLLASGRSYPGDSSPTVSGTTLDGASGGGVVGVGVIETSATLRGNETTGNESGEGDGAGIAHFSGSGVTIEENTVDSNDDGLFFAGADTDSAAATSNDITDNAVGVVNAENGTHVGAVDATGNWWGSSDGPDSGSNGSGTEGNVDSVPWSTAPGPDWNRDGAEAEGSPSVSSFSLATASSESDLQIQSPPSDPNRSES
jgi:hypothetical protein